MQRIVVTGSRGLIGRSLCRTLRAENCEVSEIDSGIAPGEQGWGDVLDAEHCHQTISDANGVFHLAAVSRVIWGERDPRRCVAINVEGTKNVLAACKASQSRPWMVLASSREVYGQANQLPVKESYPHRPINVYARSKCEAEMAVEDAVEQGLRAAIVRLSSVYGDVHDHATRVVPAFIKAALTEQPLHVEGVEGMLDFTYVEDVARGLFALGGSLNNGPCQPLHFVSGRPTLLIDLARTIVDLTASNSQILIKPARDYDVCQFFGDPSRALLELGWKNETPLEHGLAKLIRLTDLRQSWRPIGIRPQSA